MSGVAVLPSSLDSPVNLVQNELKNFDSSENNTSHLTQTSSLPSNTTSPSNTPSIMSQNQPASNSIINIIEHAIEDEEDDEFDYEALPENTSLAANLIAGATAGIMVCISSDSFFHRH